MLTRILLAVMACSLSGCIYAVVALPFMIQNDFYAKRAALKADWEKGIISHEAAQGACVRMHQQVERNHLAPPPVPDEVCDFGSFEDRRYELAIMVEEGKISQESWKHECQSITAKAAGDRNCVYDPYDDRVKAWKAAVTRGYTTKEAAQADCQRFLKERSKDMVALQTGNVCEL